ncbi:MAG: DUF86 domain-containing protein [Bacteroidaceae bacterium]|nr:DUF86 domain-containing protein [Bacteroidaceae bacterium]
MRERIRDKGRLQDILDYTNNALQFAEGVTYEEFVADRMRYFAIMKNVEIVGEAANMLTDDFQTQHPELPWHQIVGMRHVLVHGYAQISDMKLWRTVTKDLPFLREQVSRYLAETDWEKWEREPNDN